METKSTALTIFVQYGVPVLTTILLIIAKWALLKWSQKLAADTTGSKASMLWQKVNSIMQMVVLDIEGTLKPILMEATKDGVMTPEEWKKLREAALAKFWAYLGDQGRKDLSDVLGIFAPKVDEFVGSLLESAVAKIPAVTGTTSSLTDTTKPRP